MNEEIVKMLKYIRLKTLQLNWDHYIKMARDKDLSHQKFLEYIIEQEYQLKKESSRKLRLQRAKIQELYAIETYPFDRQPNLNKKKVLSLYDSFEYVTKARNVIWIGPTGVGKTGLASSFLIQAINYGYKGLYILFPDLIRELYQSKGTYFDDKVIKKFASYDALLIDELGYAEMEPVQIGMFFTMMQKRHNKKTTLT